MHVQLLWFGARLLACAAVGWLAWKWMGGPAGIAIAAPAFGALLARPIIDLVAASHRRTRELALSDLQGRLFEYRGNRIDIADDGDGHRWLLASDVRKVVERLPRDDVLRLQYPGRADVVQGTGRGQGVRLRADALHDYLRKATEPNSVRFKVWVEREVIHPTLKTVRTAVADE